MEADARIIRAAIETEIDGYRYFLDAADKSANPKVQRIWLDLASDEVEHMRILQANLASVTRVGDWEPIGDDAVPEAPAKASVAAARAPAAGSPFATDIEALQAGLKVEDRTYRFYADAAGRTASPSGQKTYQALARMEMGHYRLIEQTIEMLADPAQWQFLQAAPIQEG